MGNPKRSKIEGVVLPTEAKKVETVGRMSQQTKWKKKNGCSKAVKVKDCSSEVPSSSITKNSQVEFYESTNKEKIPIKENTLVQLGSNEKGYQDKQEGD